MNNFIFSFRSLFFFINWLFLALCNLNIEIGKQYFNFFMNDFSNKFLSLLLVSLYFFACCFAFSFAVLFWLFRLRFHFLFLNLRFFWFLFYFFNNFLFLFFCLFKLFLGLFLIGDYNRVLLNNFLGFFFNLGLDFYIDCSSVLNWLFNGN